MKSLCITGSVQSNLDRLACALRQAGAQPARSATRDREVSMVAWHDKVLSIYESSDDGQSPRLGRAWEQLAGDIYLANHDQQLWFWTSTDSVPLLDFWRDFDPGTCFLLVHTAPDIALADAIEQGADSISALQDCLATWYARTQTMLRFHLRNPERSLLIDSQASTTPRPYLQHLATNWQLPLEASKAENGSSVADSPVAQYLIQQLLDSRPQLLALHYEVKACLFQPSALEEQESACNLESALLAYLETRTRLQQSEKDNRTLHKILEDLQSQLATSTQTAERLQHALDESEAGKQNLQQRLANLQNEVQESARENDQLLTHLHQTQEELERWILSAEQIKADLQTSVVEKKNQHEQLINLQQRLTESTQRSEHLQHTLNESEADKQNLQHQLADLQRRLEVGIRESLRLNNEANEHQNQIELLENTKATLEQQLATSENENALLLLQLHETQEELEQYLLQLQRSEADLDLLGERLHKMQARYPDYWSCDNLEVTLSSERNDHQASQWQLTNLDLGGRFIPLLRFKLHLEGGVAGLTLQRSTSNGSPAPLLRWPNAFANADELPCLPSEGSVIQGNNLALTGLAQSDWQFLQALISTLANLLADSDEFRLPKQLDRRALHHGLLELQATLANWPQVLRYDNLQLLGNEQLPNYDSLHIRLENLQLGERHWPELDYRLASIDYQSEGFGQNPRLEFPEKTRASLQNWFAESQDERGSRLELRFAQPDAMDLNVWNVLSAEDRILIASLAVTLPLQLLELEQCNATLAHSWQEWLMLGESLKRILTINLASGVEHEESAT